MRNSKPLRNFLLLSSNNTDCNLLNSSGLSARPQKLLLPPPSSYTASRASRGFYQYAAGQFDCDTVNKLQNQGLNIHKDVVSGDKCEGRLVFSQESKKQVSGDNSKKRFTNFGSSPESLLQQSLLMRTGHSPPIYNTKNLETNEFRPLIEFNGVQFVDKPKIDKQLAERDVAIESSTWLVHTSYGNNNADQANTVTTLLLNCTNLLELYQIHAHVLRTNMLENHPSSFYWNNIIRSYTRLEAPGKALFVYIAMLRAGILPDYYTLPIVFKALSLVYAFGLGLQLHSVALRLGLDFDQYSESGLINLYSKVGDFECARMVFEQNHHRKLGSWNAIIAGLSQGGRAKEAVDMFIRLRQSGLEPDDVTIVSVTSACGSIGDLELSLQMHKFVFQVKVIGKSDILMSNSLIDMYGKCGYAMHGQVKQALENFRCMREAGAPPNHVTFIGVLSACVHGGMIKEGKHYFDMMKSVYAIKPQLPHYGCMVDLLGKAGLLEEARNIVEEMPMKANSVIWGCLIGACEKHGNVQMGEWAAEHLQELEPWNDGVYVVLSNIYASNGLWKEVQKVRQVMKQRQLAKVPGYSLPTRLD
ncbi:pentatricopeptide repeat-containing protein At1g77170-like isoform X2 [Momordica charantia]|uniref:Pentatricopeptide repeat-containing protein At1g77170-like isoform X2 n=1 Tax=Momordica charantia TaxID=3673 RepID=A0A6J1DA90_MOMCH|nr:pentatricopeptide repeat-containing protein At1g77170-like isoform X2 [Momordica charantia]